MHTNNNEPQILKINLTKIQNLLIIKQTISATKSLILTESLVFFSINLLRLSGPGDREEGDQGATARWRRHQIRNPADEVRPAAGNLNSRHPRRRGPSPRSPSLVNPVYFQNFEGKHAPRIPRARALCLLLCPFGPTPRRYSLIFSCARPADLRLFRPAACQRGRSPKVDRPFCPPPARRSPFRAFFSPRLCFLFSYFARL